MHCNRYALKDGSQYDDGHPKAGLKIAKKKGGGH